MAGMIRSVFALLLFMTIGMTVGAIFQIMFLRRLEETSGMGIGLFRRDVRKVKELPLPAGLLWENDSDAHILRVGLIKQEVISWAPRVIVLHNFLSSEECDHLIGVARPRLGKSTVVDHQTGKGIESKVRTSTGMFLTGADRRHPIIMAIEKRISVFSMVPVENGELLQVLRYEEEQYYKPHHDFFSDKVNLMRGGQRVATVLMYLSDGVEGGETFFPAADGDEECSCGGEMKKGICVQPKRGDAILFWSMGLDGNVDSKSLHGGCKVLKGEKWSSTKWMRQNVFT